MLRRMGVRLTQILPTETRSDDIVHAGELCYIIYGYFQCDTRT